MRIRKHCWHLNHFNCIIYISGSYFDFECAMINMCGRCYPKLVVLGRYPKLIEYRFLILNMGGVIPRYPYGRRYPRYIDVDFHMGGVIPDILI